MNSNRKRVALHTLGCKLNYTETSMIWNQLNERGYEKVNFEEVADIYIINTCSVTDNADKECRRIVRKAKNLKSDSQILVTGCYAQLKPKEIAAIDGVNCVVGANDKFRIADILEEIKDAEQTVVYSCDINDVETYKASYSVGDRTRAFLKVQDGCNYSCTYCTIPLARGKSRSDSIENVVRQTESFISKGIKEVVLSGVNIGDFGYSDNSEKRNENFLELIQALENVEGINRFRVSSIEPNLLKDEIIEFVASSEKFVPHFHIPMQSGSDKILKGMKRRYLTDLYSERISKIKSLIPHAAIGADVITGFPGETENDFDETYQFIQSLPLSYVHVFTYSERENTPAAIMKESVPQHTRNQRTKMLRILSEKQKNIFYNEHLSTIRNVLWEIEDNGGYMFGFTDNYIRVRNTFDKNLINTITPFLLEKIDSSEVVGKIL